MNAPLILNLGCGINFCNLAGWVNHDKTKHHDYVDIDADLDLFPWSWWSDEQFVVIVAIDVLEHLANPVKALEECWRILVPDGYLRLRVPNGCNYNYQTDLTHKHPFTANSLDYFVRGTEFEKKYVFYSKARFKVVEFKVTEDDNLEWLLSKDLPSDADG